MAKSWKEDVIPVLRTRLAPAAAYVFGSVAANRARGESDLDIAVLAERPIPVETLQEIAGTLMGQVGRSVDLVDFARAPETLQAEILRNGSLLFNDDENMRATLIMRALSRYQKLNDERRPILERRLGKDGWKRLF
jgi:predicted nucleotidyltransferase